MSIETERAWNAGYAMSHESLVIVDQVYLDICCLNSIASHEDAISIAVFQQTNEDHEYTVETDHGNMFAKMDNLRDNFSNINEFHVNNMDFVYTGGDIESILISGAEV